MIRKLCPAISSQKCLRPFGLRNHAEIVFHQRIAPQRPFKIGAVSYTHLNTHAGIILPAAFSTFPVFIMYRFFCGVPGSILEAAQIDGAGPLQIFLHIGLPLGSAGVVSAVVLSFLEYWNLIEQPLTFLQDKRLWPLSLYLPNISLDRAGIAFTASVTALFPAVLIFLSGQDYLEQGIIASAIKE